MAFFEKIFSVKSELEESGFEDAEQAMGRLNDRADELGMSTHELDRRTSAVGDGFENVGTVMDKVANPEMNTFSEHLDKAIGKEGALAAMADEMGKSQESVQNQLAKTDLELKKVTENGKETVKVWDSIQDKYYETGSAVSELSAQTQKFDFRLLSLMFAAREVDKALSSVLKPAAEELGIFEIIGNTLKMFFMPIMSALMPLIMNISQKFMNMDKQVKKVIGAISLAALAIAKIIQPLVMWMMNSSIITGILSRLTYVISKVASKGVIGALVAAFKSIAATVVGVIGTVFSVPVAIAAAVAAIVGFALAWKNNWFGIRQKTGKAIKWIADNLERLTFLLRAPLKPLNLMLKGLNKIPGVDIPTIDDALDSMKDTLNEVGEAAIESGNEMDKMKEKGEKADEKTNGLFDGFKAEDGMEGFGTGGYGENVSKKEFNSNVNVDAMGLDEDKIAEKVSKKQEHSFKNNL